MRANRFHIYLLSIVVIITVSKMYLVVSVNYIFIFFHTLAIAIHIYYKIVHFTAIKNYIHFCHGLLGIAFVYTNPLPNHSIQSKCCVILCDINRRNTYLVCAYNNVYMGIVYMGIYNVCFI